MGFFDNKVDNSFDAMFDFDRDGKLDFGERAAQFEYMEHEQREIEGYGDDDSDYDSDFDEALCDAGLDEMDLDDMSRDEIEDALDAAGYDIDDFDEF